LQLLVLKGELLSFQKRSLGFFPLGNLFTKDDDSANLVFGIAPGTNLPSYPLLGSIGP
jgi:hypothetical protein